MSEITSNTLLVKALHIVKVGGPFGNPAHGHAAKHVARGKRGRSVKWPALYDHLRAKGHSKRSAAMISNGLWRKKRGLPRKSIPGTRGELAIGKARDGDGDGFVHDGTPRMRPVVPSLNKPWRAQIRATWANNDKTERAKDSFRTLSGDQMITVYHGTTPEKAQQLVDSGRVSSGGKATGDLPTKGLSDLYVAPTFTDAFTYGEVVVKFDVRKDQLSPSIEAGNSDLTTAFFNSFDGAVIPEHTSIDAKQVIDLRKASQVRLEKRQWFSINGERIYANTREEAKAMAAKKMVKYSKGSPASSDVLGPLVPAVKPKKRKKMSSKERKQRMVELMGTDVAKSIMKTRTVRTAAGAKRYSRPIGSPIAGSSAVSSLKSVAGIRNPRASSGALPSGIAAARRSQPRRRRISGPPTKSKPSLGQRSSLGRGKITTHGDLKVQGDIAEVRVGGDSPGLYIWKHAGGFTLTTTQDRPWEGEIDSYKTKREVSARLTRMQVID